jgi:hypothetical protein
MVDAVLATTPTVPPLDIDDPATWPDELRELALMHAGHAADYGTDPPSNALAEAESHFRGLVGDRGVLAFHCTRLLDHEREAIWSGGLQRLGSALVRARINRAYERGAISADDHRRVSATNSYAHDAPRLREGRERQICFVIGRSGFDADPGGCEPLLGAWGGEAIRGGAGTEGALHCGTPAIVVARIARVAESPTDLMFPRLGVLLVRRCLREHPRSRYADYVHRSSDVPAADILDVWQPGHPHYDRHEELPR